MKFFVFILFVLANVTLQCPGGYNEIPMKKPNNYDVNDFFNGPIATLHHRRAGKRSVNVPEDLLKPFYYRQIGRRSVDVPEGPIKSFFYKQIGRKSRRVPEDRLKPFFYRQIRRKSRRVPENLLKPFFYKQIDYRSRRTLNSPLSDIGIKEFPRKGKLNRKHSLPEDAADWVAHEDQGGPRLDDNLTRPRKPVKWW